MHLIDIYIVKALIITIVLEELGLVILKERTAKTYIICFALNLVSNPLMNISIKIFHLKSYTFTVIIYEIIVLFIESIVYYIFNKDYKKSFITSLICNSLSLFIGILI